ncbi:major facilitator superfamily domain-containing protein [Mycena rebaudengoi]|nr:major facilitator superfamily domain-containing protein [Mycena rebaudengoi]
MLTPTSSESEKAKDPVDIGSGLPRVAKANASSTSLDKAIVYLQETGIESDAREVQSARLLRKIDWRIGPIALMVYTLQALDKLDLNYAAVMGINQELRLQGNNFNNAASAMYIANLVAEVPTGFIVQKVRPGKWLAINIMLWGIATACSAAITNYHGLLACRIFIGVFEAATAPCLMLITGMWYTKSEAIIRFAIWYCGLGIAQMLGSLISWGFQLVKHESLSGWRIMFLLLGCVTFVAGAGTYVYMPDSPMEAKWLSEIEKKAAIHRVAVNQTGIKNTHYKWRHLRELVVDPQMWLLATMTISLSLSSGVVSFYSATLIRNFGFSPTRTALLNIPSGSVSLTACLVTAYLVHKQANRTTWIAVAALLAAIGSGLMSFLPSTNKAGLLAGIYLVNVFLVFCITTANVAGQTKRRVPSSFSLPANALIAGAFSVGNIVGPQLFKPKDAPQFIPAKIVYFWQNVKKVAVQRRDEESGEVKELPNIEWMNLTDKENKTFRYIY